MLSFVNIAIPSGHSERRTLFQENSAFIANKTRAAIDANLSVILCVGETLQQREAGETAQVVEDQLKPVIDVLGESDWRCVISQQFPRPDQYPLPFLPPMHNPRTSFALHQ